MWPLLPLPLYWDPVVFFARERRCIKVLIYLLPFYSLGIVEFFGGGDTAVCEVERPPRHLH